MSMHTGPMQQKVIIHRTAAEIMHAVFITFIPLIIIIIIIIIIIFLYYNIIPRVVDVIIKFYTSYLIFSVSLL